MAPWMASILEICWIKDPTDALLISNQGSARVRLEDGTMLRITYDATTDTPSFRLAVFSLSANSSAREEMSVERIRAWMRTNPQSAEEVRRQNRSFVFFRIAGLSDEGEAIGAQACSRHGALDCYRQLTACVRHAILHPDRTASTPDQPSSVLRVQIFTGERAIRRATSLVTSVTLANSRCWCPVNSTRSRQESGCRFRRKSHRLLRKPA